MCSENNATSIDVNGADKYYLKSKSWECDNSVTAAHYWTEQWQVNRSGKYHVWICKYCFKAKIIPNDTPKTVKSVIDKPIKADRIQLLKTIIWLDRVLHR